MRGGAWMEAELMTRKRAPWHGGAREEVAALRVEPSTIQSATTRGMKEAEHMADMRGDGRGAHIEDIGTLDLGSMGVLDDEVVIKRLDRVHLMGLDLAQYHNTKQQWGWRTHVVRFLLLLLMRNPGHKKQERRWLLNRMSQRFSRTRRWE
jgi:hypothetical protein